MQSFKQSIYNTHIQLKSFYTIYISLECFFLFVLNTFISIDNFLFSTNTKKLQTKEATQDFYPPKSILILYVYKKINNLVWMFLFCLLVPFWRYVFVYLCLYI